MDIDAEDVGATIGDFFFAYWLCKSEGAKVGEEKNRCALTEKLTLFYDGREVEHSNNKQECADSVLITLE